MTCSVQPCQSNSFNALAVLSAGSAQLEGFIASFRQWSTQPASHCGLASAGASGCEDIISAMVSHAAFEGEEGVFKASSSDEAVQQKLCLLGALGFVTYSECEPGVTRSQLTRHALQNLSSWQGVARPRLVFEVNDTCSLEQLN